jgi:mutator protein MutT
VSTDVIRVVAAAIADGGRLLVCQRPVHKRHGGLWEFPGGKQEPGESDAVAVGRELGEELGVSVAEVGPELFATRDPGSPFLIAFLPVRVVGEPACREHTALRWSTPAELAALPLAPADRRFVEALLAGLADRHGLATRRRIG